MKTAIIIPARFASSRLPGKPLLDATGSPLIQHVYENALKSKEADDVFVATDDERIFNIVEKFSGKVVMTSSSHQSGTDRIAEAVKQLSGYNIIVNLQGDEPEVEPEVIDMLISIQKKYSPFMSTLACPFPIGKLSGAGSPLDSAAVKVVLKENIWDENEAVKLASYFSRSLVPFPRASGGKILKAQEYYMHIGIYAYSIDSLNTFSSWPKGRLEDFEQLEQLRALEKSKEIAVGIVENATPGIDTLEDYEAFVERYKNK